MAELFISAAVDTAHSPEVSVHPASDHKCGRCWRHLPEVAQDGALCSRCDNVVTAMDAS
ncbi:MAG: hypothetical protein B7Z16_16215 [Algoriphagus sp. 32-45-6]|nr:MAG: hypothetical protein B7Z16_16215 [Algoriphagus sp. 32-45-6]